MMAADFRYLVRPFAAIAHRGGALMPENLGLENTLEAFQNASRRGFSYFETDVHTTADGVLVAFHDSDLDRVTGRRGRIVDLTSADLRSIRIGGAAQIPTLDELLDAFPQNFINIDIKAKGAVVPLVEAIRRHNAHERVCVASFSSSRLHQFRRLIGKQVATAASPIGVAASAGMPESVRLACSKAPVWQIPMSVSGLGRNWSLFGPRMLAELHKLGKKVHIWTINDAETMHHLIELGVDGIITDRPDVLRQVLITRGMWYS